MTRSRDIKKSDFVALETTESGDYFDFTRDGQNYKILASDLTVALGVSGELQTRGEVTGVPVLRVIAGVNYIRNLLGHRGITVGVSAQDGIQIGHNFTVDATGVPVMINEGADSPTIRSIQAGNGINVSGAGGIIQIASSETPASSKTIIVYSIDDFPDPDLIETDLIILEDDTEYKLENDVSSVYRYQLGSNTLLSGADGTLITLEYTGTGSMITATDVHCKIKDIVLSCPSGSLYDISSTTGLHRFRHYKGSVVCYDMGTFDNYGLVFIDDVSYTCEDNGVVFSGNFGICILNIVGITIAAGTGNGVDLGTATFTILQMFQAFANIDTSGYVVTGLADSGNINAGGLATIQNSKQFGTATPFNGITPYDDLWEMVHNTELPNSYDVVMATHPGVTVTIATISVPVRLDTTWTTHKSYRFDSSVDGVWTYTGRGTNVEIVGSIKATIPSGEDDIAFFIAKNGTEITASRVTLTVNTIDNPGEFTIIWDESLEPSDYLEVFAVNEGSNVDIEVTEARLRIRS